MPVGLVELAGGGLGAAIGGLVQRWGGLGCAARGNGCATLCKGGDDGLVMEGVLPGARVLG